MLKLFSLAGFRRRACVSVSLAVLLILSALPSTPENTGQGEIPEINSILMESTFRIHGPKNGVSGRTAFGTGFLMGKPTKTPNTMYYVFVTAAHVLEDIGGEHGSLMIRRKQADESYKQQEWKIRLRDKDKPMYIKHPAADVAVLYVDMPNDLGVGILPEQLLATDEEIKKFRIHPGDELMCLGYPLAVSSGAGFPLLRSGKISSYPLIPTKVFKSFNFDFTVFEGNSGGPVYFVDKHRYYDKKTHLGEIIQMVVGLVSGQIGSRLYNDQMISVADVVPSSFIKEAIAMLPAESPYK
jgi:hypothetical protein